ncbi:MAG: thiamine phosphate synthase [Acidobacteria bacterium]|nr:thiamine phosphate synthase [Acidobacteriota bacterium]
MPSPGPGWPRVVLVTSRRRLVRGVGAAEDTWPAVMAEQIRGAVAGGADLIQVREPDVEAGPLSRFLRAVFTGVPGSRARIVVNDRLDLALAVGAAGVHLPERGFDVGDVSRLVEPGPRWVTGRSVHSIEAVRRSSGASYLLAGTVLATASKPDGWPLLGWEGLRSVASAARGTPVVAIGGLTAGDVPRVVASGATGMAAIGWFIPDSGRGVREFVQERVAALQFAFDRVGTVP